ALLLPCGGGRSQRRGSDGILEQGIPDPSRHHHQREHLPRRAGCARRPTSWRSYCQGKDRPGRGIRAPRAPGARRGRVRARSLDKRGGSGLMMPCSGPRGGLGMVAPRTHHALRSMAALIIGTLIVLALSHPSDAQQPTAQPVSAELTRVVGRVEILRKGQTQWAPAVVGARLVEGDDIRAFSGATAELLFPDSSTVVLAENSRLLLSKVEFDRQNQSRTVLL